MTLHFKCNYRVYTIGAKSVEIVPSGSDNSEPTDCHEDR